MADGRTVKGSKRMSKAQFDYMYRMFTENYSLLCSRNSRDNESKKSILDSICLESNATEKSVKDYWNVYRKLISEQRLNTAKIGAGILLFFLQAMENDYGEAKLERSLKLYHTYLTVTHAGEPLIWLRDHCQEYADRLGLSIDFFSSVPPQKIKRNPKESDEGYSSVSSSGSGVGDVKGLSYQYQVSELKWKEEVPPPFISREYSEELDYDNEESDESRTRPSSSPDEEGLKGKNAKVKGNRGEKIVVRIETEELKKQGISPTKLKYIASEKDGYGYDIVSYRKTESGDEHPIYIEVKTTSGNKNTPFFLSQNEVSASKKYQEDYYLYRVFNMTEDSRLVGYYVLRGDLEKQLYLKAQTYLASRKPRK